MLLLNSSIWNDQKNPIFFRQHRLSFPRLHHIYRIYVSKTLSIGNLCKNSRLVGAHWEEKNHLPDFLYLASKFLKIRESRKKCKWKNFMFFFQRGRGRGAKWKYLFLTRSKCSILNSECQVLHFKLRMIVLLLYIIKI